MSCRWQCSPFGIWGWLCSWSQNTRVASAVWAQPASRLAWVILWVGYLRWPPTNNKNIQLHYLTLCLPFTGNKGAVGVSFNFNRTSFGFVNCHLTSGSDKILRYNIYIVYTLPVIFFMKLCIYSLFDGVVFRRNQNFVDILRLLSLGDKQLGPFDISLRFTHLFWCGDLNYRLDLDVQVGNKFLHWKYLVIISIK